MNDHRGTLEPGVVALIDQSLQGAKEYIVEVREEIRSFREKQPGVTDTELIYLMFQSLREILTPEQAVMSFITILLEDDKEH